MLTMLWTYLVTNDIVKLKGAAFAIGFYLGIFYIAMDCVLFYALYSRGREK